MSVGLEQVVGGAFAGVGGGSVGVVDVAEVVGEERVAADRTGTGGGSTRIWPNAVGSTPRGASAIAGDALMIADLGRLRRTRQPPTDSGNNSGQHHSHRQTRCGPAERRHELPPSSWRFPRKSQTVEFSQPATLNATRTRKSANIDTASDRA